MTSVSSSGSGGHTGSTAAVADTPQPGVLYNLAEGTNSIAEIRRLLGAQADQITRVDSPCLSATTTPVSYLSYRDGDKELAQTRIRFEVHIHGSRAPYIFEHSYYTNQPVGEATRADGLIRMIAYNVQQALFAQSRRVLAPAAPVAGRVDDLARLKMWRANVQTVSSGRQYTPIDTEHSASTSGPRTIGFVYRIGTRLSPPEDSSDDDSHGGGSSSTLNRVDPPSGVDEELDDTDDTDDSDEDGSSDYGSCHSDPETAWPDLVLSSTEKLPGAGGSVRDMFALKPPSRPGTPERLDDDETVVIDSSSSGDEGFDPLSAEGLMVYQWL